MTAKAAERWKTGQSPVAGDHTALLAARRLAEAEAELDEVVEPVSQWRGRDFTRELRARLLSEHEESAENG